MSNLTPSSVPMSEKSKKSVKQFVCELSHLPVVAFTETDRTNWKSAFKDFEFFLCHGDEGDMNAEAFRITIKGVLREHRQFANRGDARYSEVSLPQIMSRFQRVLWDCNNPKSEHVESTGGEACVSEDMKEMFTILFEEGHLTIGGESCARCGQFGEFFRLMSNWCDRWNL